MLIAKHSQMRPSFLFSKSAFPIYLINAINDFDNLLERYSRLFDRIFNAFIFSILVSGILIAIGLKSSLPLELVLNSFLQTTSTNEVELLITERSLTIYVPEAVSLNGLCLMGLGREKCTNVVETISSLQATQGMGKSGYCYIYVEENANPSSDLRCNKVKWIPIPKPSVFWYDAEKRQILPVLVYLYDRLIVDSCDDPSGECQFNLILPTFLSLTTNNDLSQYAQTAGEEISWISKNDDPSKTALGMSPDDALAYCTKQGWSLPTPAEARSHPSTIREWAYDSNHQFWFSQDDKNGAPTSTFDHYSQDTLKYFVSDVGFRCVYIPDSSQK